MCGLIIDSLNPFLVCPFLYYSIQMRFWFTAEYINCIKYMFVCVSIMQIVLMHICFIYMEKLRGISTITSECKNNWRQTIYCIAHYDNHRHNCGLLEGVYWVNGKFVCGFFMDRHVRRIIFDKKGFEDIISWCDRAHSMIV